MTQRPAQAHGIEVEGALVRRLEERRNPSFTMIFLRGPQQPTAHHWRQGQRDDARHQDRHADGHCKFSKQPPDQAAHQQQRDEDRNQRQGHRHDREADLARSGQSSFKRRCARLDVAIDIFNHDDGIVDDEPDRDRQRHQRYVVDGVADEVHDRAGRQQRHWYGDAWNERCRHAAQEQKHDQDDEADAHRHRKLDIIDRRPDGLGAVPHDLQLHRRG